MAMFKSVNNGQKISFTLGSALARASTLRIATTLAFAGGRPQATVNGFACPAPAAPAKIDSRGVTRGAYRGNGEVYTCTVPAGTLVAGTNTVTINVISGSDGATFLSPNVVSAPSVSPLGRTRGKGLKMVAKALANVSRFYRFLMPSSFFTEQVAGTEVPCGSISG